MRPMPAVISFLGVVLSEYEHFSRTIPFMPILNCVRYIQYYQTWNTVPLMCWSFLKRKAFFYDVWGSLWPWFKKKSFRILSKNELKWTQSWVSQVNGVLCPRRSAYTPTLSSRLASLWRHISKARTEFETTPDTGQYIYLFIFIFLFLF